METDWRKAVVVAANLLEPPNRLDDDAWMAGIRKAGFSEDEARVTTLMLPVAFGRAFLIERGMDRFAETFRTRDENGRAVRLKYADQPAFGAAVDFALEASHHGALARPHFEAIAGRSAEVRIVVHHLKKGERIDPSQIVSGVNAPPSLFTQERPWWKFW